MKSKILIFKSIFLLLCRSVILVKARTITTASYSVFGSEPVSKAWSPMMASAGCYIEKNGEGFCAHSFAFAPKFSNNDPKNMDYSLKFKKQSVLPKVDRIVLGSFEKLSVCPGSFPAEEWGYLCYNGLEYGDNKFDKKFTYTVQVAVKNNSSEIWSNYQHLATLKNKEGNWQIVKKKKQK